MKTPGNAGRAKGPCRVCIVVSVESFNMELCSHKIGHGRATPQDDDCAGGQASHFVHASSKDFRVSRMREICTSGLKRG